MHVTAMNNLGICYRNEPSVKNIQEAMKYYTLASDHGHVDSLNNLGSFPMLLFAIADILYVCFLFFSFSHSCFCLLFLFSFFHLS
jgi:hypothetical protein